MNGPSILSNIFEFEIDSFDSTCYSFSQKKLYGEYPHMFIQREK